MVCVFVDSFAGIRHSWASESDTLITDLNIISTFGTFTDDNYIIEKDLVALGCHPLHLLLKLDLFLNPFLNILKNIDVRMFI